MAIGSVGTVSRCGVKGRPAQVAARSWRYRERLVVATCASLVVGLSVGAAAAGSGEKERLKTRDRLEAAAEVLEEILDAPDASIPRGLLSRAECVIVIPSMKKGGLGIGGRFGRGAVTCRRDPMPDDAAGAGSAGSRATTDTNSRSGAAETTEEPGEPVVAVKEAPGGWGAPLMLTLGGGSVGLQIGGAAIDVVMLVMNRDGMKQLLRDQFKLGADASVAAGPVGRAGSAETDILLEAKIVTYSRSKGLFAGLELQGAVLKPHHDANRSLYGRVDDLRVILFDDTTPVPEEARLLIDVLQHHSP